MKYSSTPTGGAPVEPREASVDSGWTRLHHFGFGQLLLAAGERGVFWSGHGMRVLAAVVWMPTGERGNAHAWHHQVMATRTDHDADRKRLTGTELGRVCEAFNIPADAAFENVATGPWAAGAWTWQAEVPTEPKWERVRDTLLAVFRDEPVHTPNPHARLSKRLISGWQVRADFYECWHVDPFNAAVDYVECAEGREALHD